MSAVTIRPATADDDAALVAIDHATWSAVSSPAPPPPPPPGRRGFFDPVPAVRDVLVADAGGTLAGYVALRPASQAASNAHVIAVAGLAVDPAWQGRRIGRRLVAAAVAMAQSRGARRVRLHVLGHNAAARRVYEACGFVVEGVLRDEFLLDGRYVDDVLMARDLTSDDEGPS